MWQRSLDEYQGVIRALLATIGPALQRRAQTLGITDPDISGRVLAEPVIAAVPVPAFDNSQMDGYAVIAADLAAASAEHPVVLPLGVTTAAGDGQIDHRSGTASPVMTGSIMPRGADAVVPVETTVSGQFGELIRAGEGTPIGSASFREPVLVGTFIRPCAENIATGATVLAAGTRLTPSRVGVSAAVGVTQVKVLPKLRVLLVTTGDELVVRGTGTGSGAHGTLPEGQIFDANSPMLLAALRGYGVEVTRLSCDDNPDVLRARVKEQLSSVDLVITTGGISRGAYEVVRSAFEPLGITFGSVAMQPGGPQGCGTLPPQPGDKTGTPILCFPGNPVSSLLSLEIFLAPILRELSGLPAEPEVKMLPLAHRVESPTQKHQLRRGMLNDEGAVAVFAPGSHLIGDLASATILAHFPVGMGTANAGDLIETWSMND